MKKLLTILGFTLFLTLTAMGQGEYVPFAPPIVLEQGEKAYQIPWVDGVSRQPPSAGTGQPSENRGEQYAKWLKITVRIRNVPFRWYGSGTICYYDSEKKLAYVISCGHLFRTIGDNNVEIHCFYHNDTKLAKYKSYQAKLLVYSKELDISLLSFTPDWDVDSYAPIAKEDYKMEANKTYYSCGADEAQEIACYLMKWTGMDSRSMILVQNAPRHGRSGGGLMDDNVNFIGICWGSTNPDGIGKGGKGLFVPLAKINDLLRSKGFGWLIDLPNPNDIPARLIPIVDRTGTQKEYPKTYIPLPPW